MIENRYELSDPVVTANIYCAGRLDDVISRCIAPLWQGLATGDGGGDGYVWMMRYRRGGEHLKIRLHGPKAEGPALRAALEAAVQAYFAALETEQAAGDSPAQGADSSPPIDPEDDVTEPYPDRSLVWTRYRRSEFSFGGAVYIDDDRFAALFTRGLAYGSERVLAALQPDASGQVPPRARQNTLLRSIIEGLAHIGWTSQERARYLVYHRNWLIRYLLSRSNQGPDRSAQLLERLDGNMRAMGPALQVIASALESQWSAPPDAAAGWSASLRDLADHVTSHAAGHVVDPFALHPAFPAIFKVLHGVANQLGLQVRDEAFLHHMLLHLHAPDQDTGFAAAPPASPA